MAVFVKREFILLKKFLVEVAKNMLVIKLVSIKPFIEIRQMKTMFIMGHSFSGPTMLSSIISDNQTTSSASTNIKGLSS